MSEYQYYEFMAVDRPLTREQMSELRASSTRARITTTGFINEYHFGSFKGNADAWMERYFDAFLYTANWGTNILKLRLPESFLDAKTACAYCHSEHAEVRAKDGNTILHFRSEEEEEEAAGEIRGDGLLATIVPVRADLLRGDLRALYLGWLLSAQDGVLSDDDKEPPVPAGLNQLSASLESVREFLRIDADLVVAAGASSAPLDLAQVRGVIVSNALPVAGHLLCACRHRTTPARELCTSTQLANASERLCATRAGWRNYATDWS